jgi:protoporphyrinogen IX oxidase
MYEWVLTAHIVSFIAWMAGLLYLPRLFVYHASTEAGSEASETFKVMERRLLRAIMLPASVSSWVFGLWLAAIVGVFSQSWFHAKLSLVAAMTMFHFMCGRWAGEFDCDGRAHSQRFFRFINEVPTLLMIGIVILAVVKPF